MNNPLDKEESRMSETARANKGFQRNSRYAWLIFGVTFFASWVGPMQQMKVPPNAPLLMSEFGLDPATFGWLMGCMSIVGVVLALPTIFIVRKVGIKGTVLVAVTCLAVGCAIELFSDASTVSMLFVGRIIEGTGIGLLGVAAPAGITVWFTPDKRGLPLAAWATWFPVGTIIMFNGAPWIAQTFDGWRTVWWVCLGLTIIAFLLFLIFFRLPSEGAEEEVMIKATPLECFKVLKNKNIWLLGIVFFAFNYFNLGVQSPFYNQYLGSGPTGVWGYDNQLASSFTSITVLMAMIVMPIMGLLADKTGKRKIFMILGSVVMLIGIFLMFLPPELVGHSIVLPLAFVIISGAGVASVASAARPIAPEIMPATALGVTMGMVVLQFCQNLSATAGPPIFGLLMQNFGWQLAGYGTLVPIIVIGIIAAALVKSR
jgi:MFS family permease